MFVKPSRLGLVVRDPLTMERLPDTGKEVERNSYWLRRLQAGDVVEAIAENTFKKTNKKKEEVNVNLV